MKYFIILLLFAMEQMANISAESKFKVLMSNLTYTYNKDWVTMEAKLENNILNVDMHKVKPFNRFELAVKLNAYPSDAMSPVAIIDTKIDICVFLESLDTQYKMLKDLYLNFMKFGNFEDRCPFNKDHYYLKNFQVDESILPAGVREAAYSFTFSCFVDDGSIKVTIGESTVFGEIVSK